jgi:hypothetical protein
MRALLVIGSLMLTHPALAQERLVSTNAETRTNLTFKVPDATIQKLLPQGWEVNSPTAGPTKGYNLGMSLIDQIAIQDGEGKPMEAFRGAVLTIPAKKTGSAWGGAMVFAGFPSSGAPGAYGVYVPAKVIIDRKARAEADGKTTIEEAWEFKGDDGNSMEIQLQFVRGLPARSKAEAKVFSAAKPEFYRIYRIELASDVARSTATGSDRVNKISVKAAGPKISSLFNGTEQLISVTSVPWYWRQIYLPGP